MTGFDPGLWLTLVLSPLLAAAAWVTVWVAIAAELFGIAIGFATGLMLVSPRTWLSSPARAYSWLFRGTPLLAQILFFYAALPQFELRLSVVTTGLLALGLNEGARVGQIVRAGLGAVSDEQRRAAASLGLRPWHTLFLVVLPQSLRVMIPPIGNNFSYMIKATSLLSVIAFSELLRTAQQLAQSLSRPLEAYGAAAVWYLLLVSAWSLVQAGIERRLERRGGNTRAKPARRAEPGLLPDPGSSPSPPAIAPPLVRSARQEPAVIVARGLTKARGATLALDGVDLTVRPGEVLAVMGPSGSGKSTLLRALNWLDPPDRGSVEIAGEDLGYRRGPNGDTRRRREAEIARLRQKLGMVSQALDLFPHLTARDNVAIGLRRLRGVAREDAWRTADALLDRFGLAGKAASYPSALSGGQRQRVAIARALSLEPLALLLDEPTSALDPESVSGLVALLTGLAAGGMTMVIATHEVGFARAVARRTVVLRHGRLTEEALGC